MAGSSSKTSSKSGAKSIPPKELTASLAREVKELTKEIQKLKNSEFLKVFAHPWKFMVFSLMKGMMVGLGSIIGATVLVGFLIYLLSKISFVPIIGDFVKDIMNQIQTESSGASPAPTAPVTPYNEPPVKVL